MHFDIFKGTVYPRSLSVYVKIRLIEYDIKSDYKNTASIKKL